MTTTRWFIPASYVFAGVPRTMNRPPDACTAGPASFAYAANASWFLIARYVTTQYALAMITTRVISRQSTGQDAISARDIRIAALCRKLGHDQALAASEL